MHDAREPFFLFVHTYQVHVPYNAPPPYGDVLRPDDGRALASRTPEVRARVDMARYDEEVRYTDSVMARLFSTLDALGVTSRTIVVIVADHGEAFGEHGLFYHVLSLEEEVVRVPFIWFSPGLIAAGRRVPNVVGLIDVTPTLLDLLGVAAPQFIEGLSLAPFLGDVDPPIAQATQRFVFAERMLGDSPYPVIARGPWWRTAFDATGAATVRVIAKDGHQSPALPGTAAVSVATAARGSTRITVGASRNCCRPTVHVGDRYSGSRPREKAPRARLRRVGFERRTHFGRGHALAADDLQLLPVSFRQEEEQGGEHHRHECDPGDHIRVTADAIGEESHEPSPIMAPTTAAFVIHTLAVARSAVGKISVLSAFTATVTPASKKTRPVNAVIRSDSGRSRRSRARPRRARTPGPAPPSMSDSRPNTIHPQKPSPPPVRTIVLT